MTEKPKAKYKTTNWKAYNAALKKRGGLMIWLDKDMKWQAPRTGKPGRPGTFSEAAIQFCLTIKNLFGLALCQSTGFVESLLKLSELDWTVPDFSTVSRRQEKLLVEIPARVNPSGLHLLVDSTGIKMMGEGEWKTKKYGTEYRCQWRKVHLGIDAKTPEIRVIEVTGSKVGDTAMLHRMECSCVIKVRHEQRQDRKARRIIFLGFEQSAGEDSRC